MIIQFKDSCQKLLSLMVEGKLEPEEEGHSIKDGKIVSFKNGYRLELYNLTDALFDFDHIIKENNSRNYIEKKINNFLFDHFFDTNKDKLKRIDSFFNELKNDLRKSETYLVTLFIANLSLDNEITIGEIKFLPYSIDNYMNMFKDAGYVATNGKQLLYDVPNIKLVSSIGAVTVSAQDNNKAIEKAYELVEQALNIIRFYKVGFNFGIVGNYNHPQISKTSTLNINTKTFHGSIELPKNIFLCIFTKNQYNELWKDYLSNIDSILKKPEIQRESMENKLLIALNWFGEIQKNSNHRENIIRIFSALETLLVSNKNEEKGNNVAERLAFINYSDMSGRLFAYNLVKKMYKYRNYLVHEGKTNFKEIDYNSLLMQVRLCIATVAKHVDKYPKFDQWIELINNAKFHEKLSFQ